ncbi:MAG: methyltransferase domain-containing protein [Polyangiaceae bacterium]
MTGTAEWLKQKVERYYQETTKPSYLVWAGSALGLHLGLSPNDQEDLTASPEGTRAALDRTILAMNEALADAAAIGPGARVLDAGCGVGGSSIWLARERKARVIGVTLDAGQVEIARDFAKRKAVDNVQFERADFAATPFENGSFDVVWNLESLCHAQDQRGYLAHARTLLREGGRFVCGDFFRGRGGRECDLMCEGWVLPALGSVADLAAALDDAGFIEIEVVDLTRRVYPSARVMRAMAFSELVKLEIAGRAGAPATPKYRKHFEASIAASVGLESGEITYALVSARRPQTESADRVCSSSSQE